MKRNTRLLGFLAISALLLPAHVFAQATQPAPAAGADTPAIAPAPSGANAAVQKERAAKMTKAVEILKAEANELANYQKPKLTIQWQRPHPALKDFGPEYSIDALQRMLPTLTTGEGADYKDTYVRWHLMWVVKRANQSDMSEIGPRLLQLIKKMPGPLTAKGREQYRYEPIEKWQEYQKYAYTGRIVKGYPPFQQIIDPPASYSEMSADKVAQVKADQEKAAQLAKEFKVIVDQDAINWNVRLQYIAYMLRQYRGELIYSLILTGDPEMARTVMNEIDRQAKAKSGVAFDLLAYFYLAAFDGALNLYDQSVLTELSKKLEGIARAWESGAAKEAGFINYGGYSRNFADYAFHLIYMLQDGGGFIDAKDEKS